MCLCSSSSNAQGEIEGSSREQCNNFITKRNGNNGVSGQTSYALQKLWAKYVSVRVSFLRSSLGKTSLSFFNLQSANYIPGIRVPLKIRLK